VCCQVEVSCDELITRPEESYRRCCVVVCDLETSRMGAPCIYDISRLRVNGYLGYFSEVKRSWRAVDHCFPSSAEVKSEWSCTSTSVHVYLPCVVTTIPFKSVCGPVPLSFRILSSLSAVVPFDVV